MTRATRNLVVGLAVTVTTVSTARVAAANRAAGTMADPGQRVRTSSPALARLIHDATERSATFRELIDTISTSDGIVYVEPGRCKQGGRACLVSVTGAGPNRLLWVTVDVRKADLELMATIGHELRHALEVLETRSIETTSAMLLFYSRQGYRENAGFETTAAVQAGNKIREELRQPAWKATSR